MSREADDFACMCTFVVLTIVLWIPSGVLLLVGGTEMTDPYICPLNTVSLYRTELCEYINGTLVKQEYNKNIYDNGVNMMIAGGVLAGIYLLINFILCGCYCGCDWCCKCNCKRNRKKEQNENQEQSYEI